MNLVMAQRLVRTICPNCREEYSPSEQELYRIQIPNEKLAGMKFFHGKGCSKCRYTGYKGRTAIHEILEMKQPIRTLIFEGANEEKIKNKAMELGMTPLREAGIAKIASGETTIQEVLRSTVEDF